MTEPATTTPDPEFNIPASGEPNRPRNPDSEQAAQQPEGGGPPSTGEKETKVDLTEEEDEEEARSLKIPSAPPGSDGLQGAKPGTIYSPGEGITEKEAERAAHDTGG